jgi:adhesin/invasin
VPVAPSVRVTNSSGEGVAGVSVVFAVASGDGIVTGSPAVTDASGVATVGSWTLGSTAGTNTLTATAGAIFGDNSVTFTATGEPISGNRLSFIVQPGSEQSQDKDIKPAVRVGLFDRFDNPVSGGSVLVSLTGGDPSAVLSGMTMRTTGSGGEAVFNNLRIDREATGYRLVASASGAPDISSNAFSVTR